MDNHGGAHLINCNDKSVTNINSHKFRIGRGIHCDLPIFSQIVSRVHCIIIQESNKWILKDSSSNGTIVNNKALKHFEELTLNDGDIIKLGTDEYIFQFKCAEPNPPAVSDAELVNLAHGITENNDRLQHEAAIGTILQDHNYGSPITSQQIQAKEKPNEIIENIIQTSSSNEILLDIVVGSSESNQKRKNDTPLEEVPVKVKTEDEVRTVVSEPIPQCSSALETAEGEFQCSICSELFVRAVTLNCSHTFCEYCIKQWKKQKNICPICRKKITKVTRTLVLDNFIEKILETADEETKMHRKEVIEQRENETKVNKSTKKTTLRSHSRDHNVESHVTEIRNNPTGSAEVIVLSDDGDDSLENPDLSLAGLLDEAFSGSDEYYDDDDDAGDYYYNGIPGRYYGGYGECYACGRSGHWANGCPFR